MNLFSCSKIIFSVAEALPCQQEQNKAAWATVGGLMHQRVKGPWEFWGELDVALHEPPAKLYVLTCFQVSFELKADAEILSTISL